MRNDNLLSLLDIVDFIWKLPFIVLSFMLYLILMAPFIFALRTLTRRAKQVKWVDLSAINILSFLIAGIILFFIFLSGFFWIMEVFSFIQFL